MPQITVNEAAYGFTDIITLDHNDLIAIGTGNQKIIATIPAGGSVELVGVHKAVAAVGSTSTVFSIGTTSGTATEFINALDADAMTAPVYNTGVSFVQSAGTTTIKGGAIPVGATATAAPVYLKLTDAAIASLTAGKWVVGLRIMALAKFA